MKIPYTHIKEATKDIDNHNEKREKQIERHHESENKSVSKEVADIANSEGFKKDMNWAKRNPGYLKKVLSQHYGRKYF